MAQKKTQIKNSIPVKSTKMLWTAQILLALVFIFSGISKFTMSPEQLTAQTPLPISFIYFIGVCETLGGLGMFLPSLLRLPKILTTLAATGLAIIMLGAVIVSLMAGFGILALIPLVIGALAVYVAYKRFN